MTQHESWADHGKAWCPHAEHGGNGRFFSVADVEEGWFDPGSSRAQWLAAAAAAVQVAEVKREQAVTIKVPQPVRPGATPQDCQCGCGEQTRGGRFRPGHDARYHARITRGEALHG